MMQEKWEQVIGRIKDEFDVQTHQTLDGERERETIEEIIFNGPIGVMRLTRTKRPRVLEEKTLYSNRAGSSMSVERVYSDDEFVDTVEVFKDENGEWVPVDNSMFS
ncbi:MAG: hypothetical protein AUJ34_01065 [Parcubacteria group bacterium CG1_02_41_12]|nr:MAG: hypothetical protein AUJ34_01065 [Parcubacteria group bacterium CG1_02_41_12]PIP66917.1 MAG: hypothetical protein COW93_03090 [Parcubacteria group bacterium CG22_combo_CG10-13_8_21_14_all_41_9]PIQ78009.1 MAG: hypothetical protein COV79_05695 [Parcubacteria group bacterium CG11_big_fil_rev_8_21_14_0_20_41_14]PIR56675.1 MAG: hypothetical protein COU72_05030 [Parcubacteria group bacterium CG10_big_fil_rev_8_21_14_0_10_41_35]